MVIPLAPGDCVLLSGEHRLVDSTGGGGGPTLVAGKENKSVLLVLDIENERNILSLKLKFSCSSPGEARTGGQCCGGDSGVMVV